MACAMKCPLAFHATMKPSKALGPIFQMIAILAVGSFAMGQSSSFPPSGRFLLSPPAARLIFDQCSRSAPSPKSDLWEPSTKDLDDLEASLEKYLHLRENSGKAVPPKNIKCHRQYVGFIRNGERYVYGNFYPGSEEFAVNEAIHAVQVCDGGNNFWGIVYSVKTGTFEEPQFNGVG